MKQLYILILLLFFSCAEKTKEKKETHEDSAAGAIQQGVRSSSVKEDNNSVDYTTEDISGKYELIYGKTHIIDGENYEIYKSAIVIEKLSETDFGFYSANKVKDITPIGNFGVLRSFKNNFYTLDICDGKDVEGYTEGNFTNGPYLRNPVIVYKKGDSLGIVRYGSNFRDYMLYKKKKNQSDFYISLVKTIKNTKLEYQKFLQEYEHAKNYDSTKLKIEHHFNGDVWETKHVHNEDYASFENTYSYQNPYQEGKFVRQDAVFENQFKNQVGNEPLESLNFEDVIHTMDARPLPRLENTNFDDFIEAEDYKNVDIKTLQLQKLYSGFHEKDSGFRAIRCYKLEISKAFHSVVVTILKGEHEMESLLINYDLNGEIIDSKVVSYDEIAEGQSRIESRISENTITTNHIFWDVMKEINQEVFTVKKNGILDNIDSKNLSSTLSNYPLILDVLDQLKLNPLDVKTDLVVSKIQPDDDDETIVLIPEIVSEGEQYFEFNSHIVLVNNISGKITHKYFESAKTNNWESDAIQLKELKIDTAPYIIAENERVFGVRVYYYGSSRANPYSNETISLFMKSGNTLKKVLNNYDVMNYGGEWDADCSGEFIGSKASLAMSAERTNEYFDILVKNTITETKNYEDENGDCESKDEVTTETTTLKFEGEEYKIQKKIN